MLCPQCGIDVGDTPQLCASCAQKKANLKPPSAIELQNENSNSSSEELDSERAAKQDSSSRRINSGVVPEGIRDKVSELPEEQKVWLVVGLLGAAGLFFIIAIIIAVNLFKGESQSPPVSDPIKTVKGSSNGQQNLNGQVELATTDTEPKTTWKFVTKEFDDELERNPLGYVIVGEKRLKLESMVAFWDQQRSVLKIGLFPEDIGESKRELMLRRNSVDSVMRRAYQPFITLGLYFNPLGGECNLHAVDRYYIGFHNFDDREGSESITRQDQEWIRGSANKLECSLFKDGAPITGVIKDRELLGDTEFLWHVRFDAKVGIASN